MDGKDIPQKDASGKANWTKKKGSVIIELKPSYLETLSVGRHKLTASFDDGDAVTGEFTVKAKAETPTKPSTPDTGDESNMLLWICLMAVSAGILLLVENRRRQRR